MAINETGGNDRPAGKARIGRREASSTRERGGPAGGREQDRQRRATAPAGSEQRRRDATTAAGLKSATTKRFSRVKLAATGGIRTTEADGRRTLVALDGETDAEAVAGEPEEDAK
ncbi:hypothetical protein Scep_010575 [Stephania cephalantha]|uniref:Uncharacterized protein n=1 Tax=Stephania cephalantha TaxID=152367 RepID=A0AAP0JW15_9MAGN